MKLAVVHDFLTKNGGAEKVLEIFLNQYPKTDVYTLLYDAEGTKNRFADFKVTESSLGKLPRRIKTRTKLLLPKFAQAIEEFDLSEYDTVISFSNSFAHGVLTKPKTRHISYCYSPMRYAWDWYHEYMKENKIGYGMKGLYIRNLLKNIRIWDKVAADRVDLWVAQSQTAQKRIKKYYGKDAVIINPPVPVEKIEISSDLPDKYYLIVSRLEPYKKIDMAIEAFNQNGKQLVIIGVGSDEQRLRRMANKNIEFLGWQSDGSVYEYMRNSYALIFPGEEDFGLTPVESMAAGRPVLAYKKGGVVETVIEGKTGYFFENESKDALNQVIEKLERNYKSISQQECRRQAEKFSEKVFLEKMTKLISD